MDVKLATLAEFARLEGWRKSYATQLRKDGRLIMVSTPDGDRVDVVASRALIEATKDPSKRAVAERHAAERAASETPTGGAEVAEAEPAATAGFQHWRERSERAKALAAERELALAEGQLTSTAEVAAAISDGVSMLRTRLEALPDTLGPQLAAEPDEGRCRALLAEAIEDLLGDLARKLSTMAKAPA